MARTSEHTLPPSATLSRAPRSRHRSEQAFATTIPRLSVVIVNYGQWEETARLVRQLQASAACRNGEAEIVVVDNHSPYHPIASWIRRRRGVSLRRWGRNHGYARAVNEGCRLGQGDWVLMLNPDVSVLGDFLDDVLALSDQMTAKEPDTGVVGFRLRNSDGSLQLSSGDFPTLPGTLAGLALPRARRKYRDTSSPTRREVAWVTGCCLLARRDCVRDVGGFDEDFFLYYEDVDFCRRARQRDWKVWHEPGFWAVHHRPLHLRSVPSHLRLCTRHALLTYGAKHWQRWQFRVLSAIVRYEARLRRRWAAWRNDEQGVEHFTELLELVTDLTSGRPTAALRRLKNVMDQTDSRERVIPTPEKILT